MLAQLVSLGLVLKGEIQQGLENHPNYDVLVRVSLEDALEEGEYIRSPLLCNSFALKLAVQVVDILNLLI